MILLAHLLQRDPGNTGVSGSRDLLAVTQDRPARTGLQTSDSSRLTVARRVISLAENRGSSSPVPMKCHLSGRETPIDKLFVIYYPPTMAHLQLGQIGFRRGPSR